MKHQRCGDCFYTTPFPYLPSKPADEILLMCTCKGSGYYKVSKATYACDKFKENLKSCPFCGSKAEFYGECDMVWARCSNYDCKAERICKFDEPEEAVEDWNQRV
jgi:hypothetical protein